MSENWTRDHMVTVYGEAGADAMRELSDAYARIEQLESALRDQVKKPHTSGDKGKQPPEPARPFRSVDPNHRTVVTETPGKTARSGRDSLLRQGNRQHALDALHSYIIESVDYDHPRAALVLARVTHVLDQHLAVKPRAEQDTQ